MKRLILVLITVTAFGFTYPQTADEIINKHIAAIGGADAWKKVNSIILTGSLKINGADISVIQTVLNGKGTRQDINAMGMMGYTIMSPTSGWKFFPFQGQKEPEPITADDLKESQESLDAQGNLLDYKIKGHTVDYLGTEDVDGVEALKIKETLKSGKVETLFFDPKTYYIIRTISKQKANGKESDVTTNLSNYQKSPEGLLMPWSIGLPIGELVINKVEINKPIDESIFNLPK